MLEVEGVIVRRAFIVFEILKMELMDGGGTEEQSEAFRFAYLLLRGGRAFLKAFGSGNLYLDYDKINEIYFILRLDLPGTKGLSIEEGQLVHEHNKEVMKLETKSCPISKLA